MAERACRHTNCAFRTVQPKTLPKLSQKRTQDLSHSDFSRHTPFSCNGFIFDSVDTSPSSDAHRWVGVGGGGGRPRGEGARCAPPSATDSSSAAVQWCGTDLRSRAARRGRGRVRRISMVEPGSRAQVHLH